MDANAIIEEARSLAITSAISAGFWLVMAVIILIIVAVMVWKFDWNGFRGR